MIWLATALRSFPTYSGCAAVSRDIVVDALDQPGFPPNRLSTDGVPGVARNHAHVRGGGAERLGNFGIGLWRRLVPLGGVVNAEAAIQQVFDQCMGDLVA